MSTVVDNDKYIINGSTLSDIGDALRAKNIIAPTKEVTQQVCCYRGDYATSRDNYGHYTNTTTLTEWNIQYWYGVKWGYPVPQFSYVRIYRETAAAYMKVNGTTLAAGSSVIVSLPCTLLFEGNYTCYVKFYPLDSDQKEIPWDSSYYYPSNPNDYLVHYYKENITKQVPNLIEVGNIAQSITDMAVSSLSASSLQVDFIKMSSRGTQSPSADGTNLLTTMGIKDISDIYYIIGYNDYQSDFPKGLVYLDMVNNPNPVSTSTYANQTINYYQFYYLPQTSSSSGQNPEAKPYVQWAYWKSENCFLNSRTYYTQNLAKDSNNYPAFVMVIHKPTSSS